jgi:hypothetical protein
VNVPAVTVPVVLIRCCALTPPAFRVSAWSATRKIPRTFARRIENAAARLLTPAATGRSRAAAASPSRVRVTEIWALSWTHL